ncbi:hypothetical protein KHC27_11590 [Ancylobacter lacus]|nr:hypothetical protein [Ancylobacter lacus]
MPRPAGPGAAGAWGIGLGVTALSLVLLLGAAATYLGHRVQQLDAEVQQLAIAQAEMRDALTALDAAAAAPPAPAPADAAPPAASPPPAAPPAAQPGPAASGEPPAGPAISAPELSMPSLTPEASGASEAMAPAPSPSVSTPAAPQPNPATPNPTSQAPAAANAATPAADAGAAPVAGALLGTGYTVRIFAPAQNIAGERLTRLQKTLEGLGFSVGISDDGLFEPPTSSISYHPATKAIADKLMASLRASFPKLQPDIVAPEAMPDSTRKIIILTLAAGALG